ncbi:MAG: methyltransferase [Pirellulaceae bacterium]|nr:DUF1295 domain-containing protein [Planctomycetales bacterium]
MTQLRVTSERLSNVAMGLSVVFSGFMGMAQTGSSDRWTIVRVSCAVLNLVVGSLFLFRSRPKREAPWSMIACCLPSVLIGGLAFRITPAPHAWPLGAQLLFAAAALLVVTSFVHLGTSFAVLPAIRRVIVHGPYRVIRHPAYLGELLLTVACLYANVVATREPLMPTTILLVCFVTVVLRIRVEERFLLQSADYRQYVMRTAWRLFPRIW